MSILSDGFFGSKVVCDKPCNQVGSKTVNAAVPCMFNVAYVLEFVVYCFNAYPITS